VGWTVSQRLYCGFDIHFSDVGVGWTFSIATVLWFGSQYGECVVVLAFSSATVLLIGLSVQKLCCGLDSQYSNFVLGCTVSTAL